MKETPWLAEAMPASQTFDALANSGLARFNMLGLRLSGAFTGIIRAEARARSLLDDLTVQKERAQERGAIVKGRQILFMIYAFFKTNSHTHLVHSVEDLIKLNWMGDRELHTFRHRWETIVSSSLTS